MRLLGLVFLAMSGGALAVTLEEGLEAYRSQDFALAFDVFDALAQRGDPRSTFYLSLLYEKGLGVVQNREHALQLLRSSAEAGDPLAQYNLGNHYIREGGSEFVPDLAVTWWEKAARQDLVPAQHNLGSLYAQGMGVPTDLDKARYWYGQAARNGSERSAEALRLIGSGKAPGQSAVAAAPRASNPQPGSTSTSLSGSAATSSARNRTVTPSAETPIATSDAASSTGLIELEPEWLDARPKGEFTLQLVAANKRTGIESLAARHRWQRPLLAYRISSAKGPVWALGYGIFPDSRRARQALAELPERLQKSGPWARSLEGIRARLAPPSGVSGN